MSDNNKLINKIKSGSLTGIVFDFDGTLLDIEEPLQKSIKEVLDEKELDYNMENTLKEIGALLESLQGYPLPKIVLQSYDLFRHISAFQSLTFLKALGVGTKIFSRYLSYAEEEARIFPGVKGLLNKLNKDHDLYILSHNQTKNIIEHLEKESLRKIFKGIYGADKIPAQKPDPQALEPVLQNYDSFERDQFVMVGDMPSDIEAAQTAGFKTIAIASGISNREILEQYDPDLLLDSMDELLELMDVKKKGSKSKKAAQANT
jgi:pyrophosphatase PpaX